MASNLRHMYTKKTPNGHDRSLVDSDARFARKDDGVYGETPPRSVAGERLNEKRRIMTSKTVSFFGASR